jgi:hypothetical protein
MRILMVRKTIASDFHAASKAAQRWPAFLNTLRLCADNSLGPADIKLALATLKRMQDELREHSHTINDRRDDLIAAGRKLVNCAGQTYPSAHAAALGAAQAMYFGIWAAIDPLGLSKAYDDQSVRFDIDKLFEPEWDKAKRAIRQLRRFRYSKLAALVEHERIAIRTTSGGKKKLRHRESDLRPLTPKQAEGLHIVGECQGNFAKAAKKLGKDRKTVEQNYKSGMAKIAAAGSLNNKKKPGPLPTGLRGDDEITADNDRRARTRPVDHRAGR